jgi:hypothetical protein
VFAFWQPMLLTDRGAPATSTLSRLSDPRVRQFYDPDHTFAKRLLNDARAPQPVQDCCKKNGILWDLMAVYPPGERWTEKLPVASIFNGTVVDVAGGLAEALAPPKRSAGR